MKCEQCGREMERAENTLQGIPDGVPQFYCNECIYDMILTDHGEEMARIFKEGAQE